MKRRLSCLFTAGLVLGIGINVFSPGRANAQSGSASAVPTTACTVSDGTTFTEPAIVTLDITKDAVAYYNVTDVTNGGKTEVRDTAVRKAAFRVGKSAKVVVVGYNDSDEPICSLERDYVILNPDLPLPPPVCKAKKVKKVAKVAAPAPAPAPAPTPGLTEADAQRIANAAAQSAIDGAITYGNKHGDLMVPSVVGHKCESWEAVVVGGKPSMKCKSWNKMYYDMDTIADQAQAAIPRENNIGQKAMFVLGVNAVALSEQGGGLFADGTANVDLVDDSWYVALSGSLGAVGTDRDLTGCVRIGATMALDGDRQTYLTGLGGWCGTVGDNDREDFAHGSVRVMHLLAPNVGIQGGLLAGLRVRDENRGGKVVEDGDVSGGAEGGVFVVF